ncbi:MAG: DUF418 domain-containing protein [bacterium]|nr:DUF418 domain-containing protein [bacterium]
MEATLTPTPKHEPLTPITTGDRIGSIDILRGIAIMGILLVNIKEFAFPRGFEDIYKQMFAGGIDTFIKLFTDFFIKGKFYSMFSFLFGLGMAVQYSRAAATGKKFAPFFSKRMLVLLGIALLHDILIWNGIILLMYAVLGFLLLFFTQRKSKTLLIWAAVFIISPLIITAGYSLVRKMTAPPPAQATTQLQAQEVPAGAKEKSAETNRIDATKKEETKTDEAKKEEAKQQRMEKYNESVALFRGDYSKLFFYRLGRLKRAAFSISRFGLYLLGVFLLGVWTWQRGILQNIEGHLGFLRKTFLVSLGVGAMATAGYLLMERFLPKPSVAMLTLHSILSIIAWPAMCIFFMTGVVLLLRKRQWARLLSPFAAVGRMALSNYVFQSIVCTTIFYSHGFGLFGKTSPLGNMLIDDLVFVPQVLISMWWMQRLRFGPVEWLWRSLTYGKRQPFIKK